MKKIAIITAMESEFSAIRRLYAFADQDGICSAKAYGFSILLLKSGIGKVNAALAAEEGCRLGVDLIITTGLAGGIDSSLQQGDVVLADRVCYHDVWCGTPNTKGQVQDFPVEFTAPTALLRELTVSYPAYFRCGLTVTGDQFLTDEKRLREIKQDFPHALAVDMESAAIAQVCYLRHVPFLSLRIVSDVVGTPNQEEAYERFWQNIPNTASEMVDIVIRKISSK